MLPSNLNPFMFSDNEDSINIPLKPYNEMLKNSKTSYFNDEINFEVPSQPYNNV